MLVRTPRELLNITRTRSLVHVVFHELRDLCRTELQDGLQQVLELGSLPDGSVEYALASGERYVAWTGTDPVAVNFVLRPMEREVVEARGEPYSLESIEAVGPGDNRP